MTFSSDVNQLSQQFRAALLRQERDAASQMVIYYQQTYQSMQRRLQRLLDQIAAAQDAGTPVSVSWLYEHDRLVMLMQQVQRELGIFGDYSTTLVMQLQQEFLLAGELNAQALLRTALPGIDLTFNRVASWQLAHLIGNLQDGSPLKTLFDKIAQDGAKRAGKVLFDGVAAGHGPRVIARQLRDQLSIPLHRALRISRTETIRVYNQAAMENYRANSDVVKQWEWSAANGARTCSDCSDMDGKQFDLDSDQQAPPLHPNCRCAAIPVTVSYDDILASIA